MSALLSDLFGSSSITSSSSSSSSSQETYLEHLMELTEGTFGQNYMLSGQLGGGTYGEVFKAEAKDNLHQPFVVKFVRAAYFNPSEVEIMKKIKGHQNVVQYLGLDHNQNYFHIFMSFDGAVTFDGYLQSVPPLNEDQLRFFFKQMLSAVSFLDSMNIVHLDIKHDNLILNSNCHLRLIDFGMSKDLSREGFGPFQGSFGTKIFMAPEMLRGIGNGICYPKKADIWSLGVTLYASYFRRFPYNVTDDYFIINNGRSLYASIRRQYSNEFRDLLNNMLHFDLSRRLTIEQVSSSDWVNNLKNNSEDSTDSESIQDTSDTSSFNETISLGEVGIDYIDEDAEIEANYIDEDFEIEANYVDEDAEIEANYIDEDAEIETNYVDEDAEIEVNYIDEDAEIETDYTDEDPAIEANYTDEDAEIEANYIDEDAEIEANYVDEDAEVEANYTDEDAEIETDYTEEDAKIETEYTDKEIINEESCLTRDTVLKGARIAIQCALTLYHGYWPF